MKAVGVLIHENRPDEVHNVSLVHPHRGGLQFHRNTSASNDNLQACAPCDLLFVFVSAVLVKLWVNPPCIDQEPLCCCCWASRPSSPSSWAVSPSKHLRFKRQLPGVRSSRPAVCTPLSSPSQTLGPIRPVLTESRHAAVRLLDLLRRLRGLYVHRSTSASNDNLQEYDPRC